MITHQFVENIGRRLMAVHAEERAVAEEMQRAEQTARGRLQALRDEAANIDALLDSLNRFDQSSIESFLAGEAGSNPAPQALDDGADRQQPRVVADGAEGSDHVAPAAARAVHRDPVPDVPDVAAEASNGGLVPADAAVVAAGGNTAPQPEARGLKEADAKILIVMRAEREADGICRMSMTQIAKLAGVPQKSAAEQCVKRLRTAGIIMPTKHDQTIFHVADRGQRVPIAIQTKPAAKAPARFSLPTTSEVQLDEKLFDLIARAARAGGGQALFELSKLGNQMGVNQLRLDCSLTRLAEQRRLVRCKSLPGHATFEVLDRQEAAE